MQIRQFIATAWHTVFEASAQLNGTTRSVLNTYFAQCMNGMLNCLFSEETLASGTLLSISNSVNTVLESCDHENLKSELFTICEFIYNKVTEFNNASQTSTLNMEQRELFINNWCSSLQPCLVRVGSEGITDQMLSLFIDLAINIFQMYGKVMNGGLFILHGLITTVDHRITPFLHKFIDYIVCSMRMENCD